jgi:hypothetical protein
MYAFLKERLMQTDIAVVTSRLAISDILNRYCIGLDLMALDDVAGLFTDDCFVSYGPEERLTSIGRTRLRQDLERLWRWRRTSHHLSNIIVSVERDTATAQSYVIAWHELADGSSATIYGRYDDELVRTPAGWRIARRAQYMNGNDAGFTVNIHPTPRRPPPDGWVAPKIDR